MAEGAQKERWNHTASLVAKLHNVNCTRKPDMIRAEEVHPFMGKKRSSRGIPLTRGNLRSLKSWATKRGPKRAPARKPEEG